MELLKKKRGGFRSQLTQVNKQVQGIWESRNTAELDPLELQSIKMRIQNIESKLSELDGEIGNSIAADDETEMDEEASKAVYYSEIVWDMVSKVDILIQKFSPETVPVQNSEHVASNANQKPATKLPKLTIQTFDGDPLNWQGFWDSYRHSIHENKDLDEIEKFQHLKSLLTGDAKVAADGYRLTSANYSAVIEVLVDRFGSEELAVFAHFDKLLALPMSSTDTQKLQATYDATEKHIRSLVSLGLGEETFGQVFTPIILSKLPRSIRTDLHRRNGSNRWTLSHLRELFRDEIKARQMGDWTLDQHPDRRNWKQGPQSQGKGSNGNPKPLPHTGGALSGGAVKGSGKKGDRPLKCLFCSGNHRHSECKQVTTADARRELAKGLCYRCLRKGHMSKNCEKPPKCYFCGQNTHHSSLCFSQFGTPAQKDSSGSKGFPKNSGMLGATVDGQTGLDPSTPPFQPDPHSTGPTSFQGVANSSAKPGFVQMQMASVKLGSIQSPIRIFFDCGCSRSYITSSLAKGLGLKSVGKELISNGRFEDKQRRTHSYSRVELSLPTLESPVHLSLLVTETIACPITRVPIDMQRYPILQSVPLADPPPKSPENVSIDILVGLDHYYQLIGGKRIDLPGGLVLLGSKLGYITAGPVPETQAGDSVQPSYLAALFSGSSSVSFQNADLERFWSLEDIGIKDDSYAKDDELALRRFNDSIRYDGSRYEVGWPWKSDNPDLPSNYDLANGRLKSLMKRLHKEPDLLNVYDKTIKAQLDSKIIEEVPDNSADGTRVHYLPHHCVVKPDRATTKVRIVYDGSATVA